MKAKEEEMLRMTNEISRQKEEKKELQGRLIQKDAGIEKVEAANLELINSHKILENKFQEYIKENATELVESKACCVELAVCIYIYIYI